MDAPLFVDSFIFVGACSDLWCALTRTDGRSGGEFGWAAHNLGAQTAARHRRSNQLRAERRARPAHRAGTHRRPNTAPALVVTEVVLMLIARRAARYRAQRLTGHAQPQKTEQPGLAGPDRSVAGRDCTPKPASSSPPGKPTAAR